MKTPHPVANHDEDDEVKDEDEDEDGDAGDHEGEGRPTAHFEKHDFASRAEISWRPLLFDFVNARSVLAQRRGNSAKDNRYYGGSRPTSQCAVSRPAGAISAGHTDSAAYALCLLPW